MNRLLLVEVFAREDDEIVIRGARERDTRPQEGQLREPQQHDIASASLVTVLYPSA